MSKKKGKSKENVAAVKAMKFYTSSCCGVQAIKPALKASKEWREAGETNDAGQGKWRCTTCKKRCKVTVSKAETV